MTWIKKTTLKNTTLLAWGELKIKCNVHIIGKRMDVPVKIKNIVGIHDMFVMVGIIFHLLIVGKNPVIEMKKQHENYKCC